MVVYTQGYLTYSPKPLWHLKKQRQRHDTANKQADNGVLQWRQTGASYQGLMTLIGQQTAPRLDRGLDDGGGTANGVRPTENESGDTGKQPHT